MGEDSDLQEFIKLLEGATTPLQLELLLGDMAKLFHFDHFALMHHVPNPLKYNAAHLINYPAGWVEKVAKKKYWKDDPIAAACRRRASGFLWSQVPRFFTLRGRHLEILEAARHHGMSEGFTVPANFQGELSGSVNFGVKSGKEIPYEYLASAQRLGTIAYEAARNIALCGAVAPEAPALTTRQYDCIILVARGNNDCEAARALGISPDTVHKHVKTAMKKYGVATRTQLVVRTLFHGQLVLNDFAN